MSRAALDQAWRYALDSLPASGRYAVTATASSPDSTLVTVYFKDGAAAAERMFKHRGDIVTGLRRAGDFLRDMEDDGAPAP
jgi:hypothetical protein